MNKQCFSANFLQEKNVTDSLDKYVVLAFFITLILAIILVILLTKYIAYHLQRQRVKEEEIKERKSFRKPTNKIEEEYDSDDEFHWSESEEGTVDLKASLENFNEIESDTISFHNLETNYVGKIAKDDVSINKTSKRQLEFSEGDNYDTLLRKLQPIEMAAISATVSPFMYLFSGSFNGNKCIQGSNLQENINYIFSFRQNTFQSLCNFILDAFCKSHIISEDLRMFLKSKYDQQIDECINSGSVAQILHFSHIVQEMSKQFVHDMKKYNKSDQKQSQNLQNLLQCFFTLHLDCIKVLSSELLTFAELNNTCERSICEVNIDVNKILTMSKYRVMFLKISIINMENNAEVVKFVDDHNNKVVSMLDGLENDLKKQVQNTLSKLNRIRSEELKKLSLKYNREESNLKLEVLELKDGIDDKLKTFQTYLIALFTSHLKERNDLLVELIEYESKEMKQTFNKFQKLLMSDMSNLEEDLFASLNQHCNFSEDKILSVAENVQQQLQNTKQEYLNVKNEFLQISSNAIQTQSKTISVFIDYFIKHISFEFKFLISSVNDSLKFLPSIQPDLLEEILISIKQKLSVAVFDLVASLSISLPTTVFIKELSDSDTSQESMFENILTAMKSDILNHDGNISDVNTDVLNSLKHICEVNNLPIDELYLRYYSAIIYTMHEKVLGSFEKELDSHLIQSIMVHKEDHMHVYERVKDFVLSIKNIHSNDSDQKYMSRKGSSFKDKPKDKELEDEYDSHLSMKEIKVRESCKQIERDDLKNSIKQKNKNQSVNQSCINVLKSELESLDNVNNEYIQNLFELEHHYMIERFLKKVVLLTEENENHHEEERRKSRSVSKKSVKITTPRSSSVQSDSNAEQKTTKKKQSKLMAMLKYDNTDEKEDGKKGKSSSRNTIRPVDKSPRKLTKKSISAMKATVSPETEIKKKSGKNKGV